MGWSEIYVGNRVNTDDVNRVIEEAILSPHYHTIDRSGWIGRTHQFVLCEFEPDYQPDMPARRLIMVALVQNAKDLLRYKLLDETAGPNERDCPLRILKAAEVYPAYNETAATWRTQCRSYHKAMKRFNRILREVDQNPKSADRRVLLHGGRLVEYHRIHDGRQRVKTFRIEGDRTHYRLNMRAVDVEGTVALHRLSQQAT